MSKSIKWILIIIGLFFGLFFLLLVIGFMAGSSSVICTDMNCFITKANQCKQAVYIETTDAGRIGYSVSSDNNDNCILTKEIVELSENEDPFIKEALKGKMMKCTYSKGEFNDQWTTSMIEGIEYCNGELKDAIGQLLLLV